MAPRLPLHYSRGSSCRGHRWRSGGGGDGDDGGREEPPAYGDDPGGVDGGCENGRYWRHLAGWCTRSRGREQADRRDDPAANRRPAPGAGLNKIRNNKNCRVVCCRLGSTSHRLDEHLPVLYDE